MAGDSLLAVFNSALEAVSCTLDIQERLRAANRRLPWEDRMCFRLGIDLGDVLHQGRQVYGDAVNIAARLQALSPPAVFSFPVPFTTRYEANSLGTLLIKARRN